MAKNFKNCISAAMVFIIAFIALNAEAQFSLTGQLRTRTEVRNGLGNLVLRGSKSAVFTSQRTRLIFGYKWDRLTFGASIQDVRVWGQDASTISNADGSKLGVHEAWAEIIVANKRDTGFKSANGPDYFGVKIGVGSYLVVQMTTSISILHLLAFLLIGALEKH